MSLLLLKTRDLTWQDHTLNTEVMLAPARSGLLLNKHKTLGARCQMDTKLYERQRAQCVKDFLSSRRLIDRQRQKLLQKQRELRTKHPPRVMSAAAAAPTNTLASTSKLAAATAAAASFKERSASAPGERVGMELPAFYIDTGVVSSDNSDSSSFFVTEMVDSSTPLPCFPVPSTRIGLISTPLNRGYVPGRTSLRNRTPIIHDKPTLTLNKASSRNRTPTQCTTPTRNKTPTRNRTPTRNQTPTRSQIPIHRKRTSVSSTPGPFPMPFRSTSLYNTDRSLEQNDIFSRLSAATVRFMDEKNPTEEQEEEATTKDQSKMRDPALEGKVRAFIEDIKDFTTARRLGKDPKNKARSEGSALFERREAPRTPAGGKRLSAWSVDQTQLLSVFEQFCNVQTPEELARTMRVASKLKSNVRVNPSIVPSVASYKSMRSFKALTSREI